jgi:hypothetical protein
VIGHVVPWCLGCGLDAHHLDLFDEYGDPIFDDDAFDREVLAERLGGEELDAVALARALGVHRSAVWIYVKRGHLPAPKRRVPCSGGLKALWSAEQIAGVMLARGMA